MNYLNSLLMYYKGNYKGVLAFISLCILLYTVLNTYQVPVYYIPDIVIFLFFIYAFININQTISFGILIPIFLLIYFICFSPDKLDIEFNNKFYVTLKPLIYLIIIYLVSAIKLKINVKPFVYSLLFLYPIILLWSMFLYYLNGYGLLTRPYFIFENNFEIPVILACFCITSFIYKDKDIRLFALASLAVLMTGSRSGLIGFVLVAIPHLFSLGRRKFFVGMLIFSIVVGYLIYLRGIPAFSWNSIDRVQTLKGMFAYFHNDYFELLSYPLGLGIYAKIPLFFCTSLGPWAEWFTGSFFNCDPLLFQSYFTRSFFQLGVYVTLYIPVAFFLELRHRMNFGLAAIAIFPVLAVSLSAGGFSNGLSFISMMLFLIAYEQQSFSSKHVIHHHH
jgi:hypothetical protein